MSDFKGVIKNGWHPKGKDGGKESWRGDFKGINQVAGWMGKGKQADTQAAKEHISKPLATLKDPASFGPPPKNVNYHGGAALPNEITPHRSGLGAPLNQAEIESARQIAEEEQEKETIEKPAPPPLPYRADRTGLRTDNLPPPPVHRDLTQFASPPVRSQPSPSVPQPKLPPRLPARQNTTSPPVVEVAPPSYETVATKPTTDPYLNQSAVNRLGKAGISVPGFGIGQKTEANPWEEETSQSQKSGTPQFSDLQSRFAKMRGPSQDVVPASTTVPGNHADAQPTSQTAMPSWKQSQSAFKTAQNLRTNPQSVTLADAQSAAQTAGQAQRSANAFREKHADSIANAQAKAKAWDQRYKVTSKINKFLDEHTEPDEANAQQPQQPVAPNGQQYQQQASAVPSYSPVSQVPAHTGTVPQVMPSPPPTELAASIARKPPPPPAPRKPAHMQAPPPVPTGTKPSLG